MASFWRFLSPRSPPLRIHWPLATILPPHAPRLTPHARPAGSGRARTLPAGYCHPPTAELTKTERDPISTSGPSIFSMSPKFSMLPNQAISSDKSIRFSPLAAARPWITPSWPETVNTSGYRRACRMAISRNAPPCPAATRPNQEPSRRWPSPSAMTGEPLCEGRPDETGDLSHVLPYPSPRSDPARQRSSGRACRILELATADASRASRLPLTLPTGADWLEEVARQPEFSVRGYSPRWSGRISHIATNELFIQLRARKRPLTFWHQGNVGGFFHPMADVPVAMNRDPNPLAR